MLVQKIKHLLLAGDLDGNLDALDPAAVETDEWDRHAHVRRLASHAVAPVLQREARTDQGDALPERLILDQDDRTGSATGFLESHGDARRRDRLKVRVDGNHREHVAIQWREMGDPGSPQGLIRNVQTGQLFELGIGDTEVP